MGLDLLPVESKAIGGFLSVSLLEIFYEFHSFFYLYFLRFFAKANPRRNRGGVFLEIYLHVAVHRLLPSFNDVTGMLVDISVKLSIGILSIW